MIENGTVISHRYEVKSRIGSGGTSSVYLVTDRHIGRMLAMKVMDRRAFGSLRFARSEIESLRRVRFPLFPAIHDAFTDDENIYIVSEYVRGRSLWEICRGRGIGSDRALSITQNICQALSYLHNMDKPMLYLDLKPDNIIIDDEGLPHMIDFGIAGWLAEKHVPVGTIGYSPPEQYLRDSMMDARTDIYALGMTYYAIRHGIPPDPENGQENITHSHILKRSEKSFLIKCTALAMDERYKDSDEVIKQIRHIRSKSHRIRKKIVIIAVASGVLTTGRILATEAVKHIRQNEAASRLIEEASAYMDEGLYTPEGIGLIKASINSNTLSEEAEQNFIFEVAVSSMLVTRDYKSAQAYFARLDSGKYPEAEDYIRICRLQNGFDEDSAEAMEVTSKMFSDVVKRKPSKMKYENLIFISRCFENYDDDPAEGAAKALSVLTLAKKELDSLEKENDPLTEDPQISSIRERIGQLEEIRRKQMILRRQNNKVIGDKNEKNSKDK